MRQVRMNLKCLLIIWMNYDPEMSGEDTRQEEGEDTPRRRRGEKQQYPELKEEFC